MDTKEQIRKLKQNVKSLRAKNKVLLIKNEVITIDSFSLARDLKVSADKIKTLLNRASLSEKSLVELQSEKRDLDTEKLELEQGIIGLVKKLH